MTTRRIALGLLLLLCMSMVAADQSQYRPAPGKASQPPRKEGDLIQRVTVDLDGDGVAEHIVLLRGVAMDSHQQAYSATLMVRDQSGRALWQGRGTPDGTMQVPGGMLEMAFNGAATEIEMVADIDGDGSVECVVSPSTTFGRPVGWQILRWDRQQKVFVLAQVGPLEESSPGSGCFVQKESAGELPRAWIHRFYESSRPGLCHVQVAKQKSSSRELVIGEALVEARSLSELKITRWLVPLK